MKRIIDYDPLSGITTTFDYDPVTDMTIIGREQDVEHILKISKALQNDDAYTRQGFKDDWWHYAIIPNIVIEKWINELGVNAFDKNDRKRVYQLLNDPMYRYLKTTSKHHLPAR